MRSRRTLGPKPAFALCIIIIIIIINIIVAVSCIHAWRRGVYGGHNRYFADVMCGPPMNSNYESRIMEPSVKQQFISLLTPTAVNIRPRMTLLKCIIYYAAAVPPLLLLLSSGFLRRFAYCLQIIFKHVNTCVY